MLLFLDLHGASESQNRLAARLVRRHAAADVLLGEQIEVGGHLAIELGVEPARR